MCFKRGLFETQNLVPLQKKQRPPGAGCVKTTSGPNVEKVPGRKVFMVDSEAERSRSTGEPDRAFSLGQFGSSTWWFAVFLGGEKLPSSIGIIHKPL